MTFRTVVTSAFVYTALVAPAQAVQPAKGPLAQAVKLADWHLAPLTDTSHIERANDETRAIRGWEQAVFWIGMTALADQSPDSAFELMR